MQRVTTVLAVMTIVAAGLVTGVVLRGGSAGAQTIGGITIAEAGSPAFNGDAPDPDVVRDGADYYAFTTGTVLGNHLQALIDTSGSPESGWRSYTGTAFGSTALPVIPEWEQVNTQTSPGVFFWGGQWLMYYDAAQYGHAGDTGYNCLAVATDPSLNTSDPVFTDNSPTPLLCQPGLGGAIDPSPFIDPVTGQAYLDWKSNDGGSSQPAQLWSQQLSANGLSLVGSPQLLLTQNTGTFPWETDVYKRQVVGVTVDGRQPGQVSQEHQHHRNSVEVLGKSTRSLRRGRGEGGSVGHRPTLEFAVGDRRPRGETRSRLGQVLVPPWEIQIPQHPARLRVLDHDHPPRLPVAPVGGEASGVEQPVDGLVGNLDAGVLAYGAGGAEGVDEFHAPDGSGGGDRACRRLSIQAPMADPSDRAG